MLQGEHSAILLTFIKLPSVIKIFVLSFLSDCLRQVLLYAFLGIMENNVDPTCISWLKLADQDSVVN